MTKSAAKMSRLLEFRKGYFSSAAAFLFSFSTIHEIVGPGPEMELLKAFSQLL
jgi:hypothetical protein